MNHESSFPQFGDAAKCSSLQEITALINANTCNEILRKQCAAFGLLLSALQAQGPTAYFEDSRHLLDQVSRAKAEIDIAAWHDMSIVGLTSSVLLAAQKYFTEMTIPCTEWPSPKELIEVIAKEGQGLTSA